MPIFISYIEEDQEVAKKLYNDLKRNGFEVWIDFENILPGQDRMQAIQQAIKKSLIFIMLLSTNSISKRGKVQKEQKIALDILDEFPDDQVYIIPVRLDNCTPSRLKLQNIQWVDLFPSYQDGLNRILDSLKTTALSSKHNIDFAPRNTEQNNTIFINSVEDQGADTKQKSGIAHRSPSKRIKYLRLCSVALLFLAIMGPAIFMLFNHYLPRNQAALDKRGLNQLDPGIQKVLEIAYSVIRSVPAPETAFGVMKYRVEDNTNGWREIDNGDTLCELDIYKIRMFSSSPAFAYVIQIDSQGKLDWLFPENPVNAFSSGKNPVPAGKWIQVPTEDKAFKLDDNTGVEHLYVIVTQSRWMELEQALKSASGKPSRSSPVREAMKLKSRGVGGVIDAPPMPDELAADSPRNERRMMQGREGVLILEKWFHHVSECR